MSGKIYHNNGVQTILTLTENLILQPIQFDFRVEYV